MSQLKIMNDLELKAINKAVQILNNLNCKVFVVLPNGEQIGEPPQKANKRNLKIPFGSAIKHFKPYIENLKAGDLAIVPIGDLPASSISSSMSAYMSKTWGNGSYNFQRVGSEFHILRLM